MCYYLRKEERVNNKTLTKEMGMASLIIKKFTEQGIKFTSDNKVNLKGAIESEVPNEELRKRLHHIFDSLYSE